MPLHGPPHNSVNRIDATDAFRLVLSEITGAFLVAQFGLARRMSRGSAVFRLGNRSRPVLERRALERLASEVHIGLDRPVSRAFWHMFPKAERPRLAAPQVPLEPQGVHGAAFVLLWSVGGGSYDG